MNITKMSFIPSISAAASAGPGGRYGGVQEDVLKINDLIAELVGKKKPSKKKKKPYRRAGKVVFPLDELETAAAVEQASKETFKKGYAAAVLNQFPRLIDTTTGKQTIYPDTYAALDVASNVIKNESFDINTGKYVDFLAGASKLEPLNMGFPSIQELLNTGKSASAIGRTRTNELESIITLNTEIQPGEEERLRNRVRRLEGNPNIPNRKNRLREARNDLDLYESRGVITSNKKDKLPADLDPLKASKYFAIPREAPKSATKVAILPTNFMVKGPLTPKESLEEAFEMYGLGKKDTEEIKKMKIFSGYNVDFTKLELEKDTHPEISLTGRKYLSKETTLEKKLNEETNSYEKKKVRSIMNKLEDEAERISHNYRQGRITKLLELKQQQGSLDQIMDTVLGGRLRTQENIETIIQSNKENIGITVLEDIMKEFDIKEAPEHMKKSIDNYMDEYFEEFKERYPRDSELEEDVV